MAARAPRKEAAKKLGQEKTLVPFTISADAVAQSRSKGNAKLHPFIRANHPPQVFPKDVSSEQRLAMDNSIDSALAWASEISIASAFEEGLAFLGYPYLSQLAQRSEYRRISEIIATEMTRKWITFQSKSTGNESEPTEEGKAAEKDKTEKINQLKDEMLRLDVQGKFREAAEQDGFFGRSHIYIDLGTTDDRDELRTPIGNGLDELSKSKVKKGSLKALKCIEAVWCYPSDYNSNDPMKGDWYKPRRWFVMGKELHVSRLPTFIGREVPDLLKPAYSFGGLSLSQMAKPYVDNWLRTRQSVSDLLHSFSVFVLEMDMSTVLQQGVDQLFRRIELFNNLRDNRGVMAINKDTEGFQNVSAPLSSLDALQAQSQEHICSVTGIPLIKYTGISPMGLNASSEGELRVFYDWIAAYQESLFRHNLEKIIRFVMLNLWGEVDEDIIFVFEPLWSLDEKAQAELRKQEADIDLGYLQGGVLSELEIRKRLAATPDCPYQGLEVEDVPEQEEEGLMGGGPEEEGEEKNEKTIQGEAGFGGVKHHPPGREEEGKSQEDAIRDAVKQATDAALGIVSTDLRSIRDALMNTAARIALDERPQPPHITVEAPQVNVTSPPVTVTMPPITLQPPAPGDKSVRMERQADGSFVGIVEHRVKLERKEDGTVSLAPVTVDA